MNRKYMVNIVTGAFGASHEFFVFAESEDDAIDTVRYFIKAVDGNNEAVKSITAALD